MERGPCAPGSGDQFALCPRQQAQSIFLAAADRKTRGFGFRLCWRLGCGVDFHRLKGGAGKRYPRDIPGRRQAGAFKTAQAGNIPGIECIRRHHWNHVKRVTTLPQTTECPRKGDADDVDGIRMRPIRTQERIAYFIRNPFPRIRSRPGSRRLSMHMALGAREDCKFQRRVK